MKRLLVLWLIITGGCNSGVGSNEGGGQNDAPASSTVPAANEGAGNQSELDTDGDGFTDDEETNMIPGTDPFDRTDNPNNVRDSDNDGCSDFDEINFDGFCDNNPITETQLACDVSYYNSDFEYGFDLPTSARLERFDDEQNFEFKVLLQFSCSENGLPEPETPISPGV